MVMRQKSRFFSFKNVACLVAYPVLLCNVASHRENDQQIITRVGKYSY